MKPYIGMPVKIVRGFSVGSRGKITEICDREKEPFGYDVLVLRDGASSSVGYMMQEIMSDEPPPTPEIRLATALAGAEGYIELTAVIDSQTRIFRIKRQTAASMVGAIARALADNLEVDVVPNL